MNGRDRPRPPPAGDSRRGGDLRNGPADSSMSRAEKFEDEKKRIIQSCYSKKDSDGTCMWNSQSPFSFLDGGLPFPASRGITFRRVVS